MEVALVWWLVVFNVSATSGGTVIPIPYTSEQSCLNAMTLVPSGECVPQSVGEVIKWTRAHNVYGENDAYDE